MASKIEVILKNRNMLGSTVAAAGALFSWFFGYMFNEISMKNHRKIGSKTEHAPKTRQDASKTRRRRPKTPPRRPRTPPRRAQDAPRRPQDAPGRAQDAPRGAQDAPKTPPRRSTIGTKIRPKTHSLRDLDFDGFWGGFWRFLGGFWGGFWRFCGVDFR